MEEWKRLEMAVQVGREGGRGVDGGVEASGDCRAGR